MVKKPHFAYIYIYDFVSFLLQRRYEIEHFIFSYPFCHFLGLADRKFPNLGHFFVFLPTFLCLYIIYTVVAMINEMNNYIYIYSMHVYVNNKNSTNVYIYNIYII